MKDDIKIVIEQESFWNSILQEAISGLVIGLTLAIIGYFIWKKQNLYSKKFEVYINVIGAVEEIYRITFHDLTMKGISFVDEYLELSEDHIKDLRKNKLLFNAFFGDQYNEKIEYFINIKKHLDEVMVTIKHNDGHSLSKLIEQKEQTSEILNHHRQMVINKMGVYLEDLKLVNKGLKKYALLKD
jgi:hypothetical protein